MTSSPSERRASLRRSFPIHGSNPVVATVGVVPRAAFVLDLCAEGAGLLTTDPPPVGSVVPLWLAVPPGSQSRLVLVRVVYTEPLQDGLHRIGLSCQDDAGIAVFRELLNGSPVSD